MSVSVTDLLGLHTVDGYGEDCTAWLIHDMKIGNISLFSQSVPIPAEAFVKATEYVTTTCQAGQDIQLVVEYVGSNPNGKSFHAAVVGSIDGFKAVLPLSAGNILPGSKAQITCRPQIGPFRPNRLVLTPLYEAHTLLRVDGVVYDFVEGCIEIADLERVGLVQSFSPMVLTFRLHNDVLWAVREDEASPIVVFEIKHSKVRWNPAGFVPTWWNEI